MLRVLAAFQQCHQRSHYTEILRKHFSIYWHEFPQRENLDFETLHVALEMLIRQVEFEFS